MKRCFRVCLLVVALITVLYGTPMAIDDLVLMGTPPYVLLNAQTATGFGVEQPLGRAYCQWSCTAVWGGTVPTSINMAIVLADTSGVYDASGAEGCSGNECKPVEMVHNQ